MPIKILVLGASGMLGSAILRLFSQSEGFQATGTVRSSNSIDSIRTGANTRVLSGVDAENTDHLISILNKERPDYVINCIGLVKQLSDSNNPLLALPLNAILPHRLAQLCALSESRLVHFSTDCVFSGLKGKYIETDTPDATDLYGRSKLLGEVDYPNSITLRTSIIGHELAGSRSLVEWFLGQKKSVKGYKKAIFSGLPTVEIAKLIRDYIIPNPQLSGIYHVSSEPINKYDLLKLIAHHYNKKIKIELDESVTIDRSLDSSRFREITGFKPRIWPELVNSMKEFG